MRILKFETMKDKIGLLWFVAFTGIFAILAAYVFWGTWSPDYAPVMPDDAVWHPLAYSEQFAGFIRRFLNGEEFAPTKIFWDGALPMYAMQEFKYAVCLCLAGLALAFFLRERGLSLIASYGAGIFLGFCGYWMTLFSAGHGGWFIIMPFVVMAFGFVDRVAKSGRLRDGILLGASVGWGASHQHDLFLLFAVFIAIYGSYACIRERKFPLKAGLVALLMFCVIGGPGIRSAFTDSLSGRDQQIAESAGTALAGGKGKTADDASDAEKQKAADEARWVFATNWSMPPEDTLEFFIPRIHGDTSCPMTLQLGRAVGKDVKPYTGRLGRPLNAPAGNYRQHSLYVGRVTCFMALFAIVICVLRKKVTSDVAFFAVAAFVFWLFSMGRFCEPVYRLVYALPFGDYLRAPVKWHHVTEFCLCVLAGFGLDALFAILKRRIPNPKVAFSIVSALIIVGAWDLAANDKLFCAPIDLRIVHGKNAAADEVVKRGKGTTSDMLEGGRGILNWSFGARGVGMNSNPLAADTRFVFVGNEQVRQTPQLANWLKAKATLVGTYSFLRDGIRSAAPQNSNVSLYQVNGVPPPQPPTRSPIKPLPIALGIISILGSVVAFVAMFWRRSIAGNVV